MNVLCNCGGRTPCIQRFCDSIPLVQARTDDVLAVADCIEEVRQAGGDMPSLAALARQSGARTELTAALKALGFKGLRSRQQIEAELKKWRPGM